jgi:carbonic anhydrase
MPLIVVLGHSQCETVGAVVQNEKVHGNVAALMKALAPAAARAKAENPGAGTEALIHAAILANIWEAVGNLLQESQEIKAGAKAGKVKVIGALYEIDTGQVQWLGAHPEQNKLLGVAAKAGPKGKKSEGQKSAR